MIGKKIKNTSNKLASTREGFGEGVLELAKNNKDVIALSADLTASLKLTKFEKEYPKQFVQVGVAEQNLAGVAAGLALGGKVPFATSFAAFNPGRNWDQIRVSICYSNLNVKIVGGHAGLNVGPDGATHQALEDIAITRVLPNMTVIVPADVNQAKQATLALGNHVGPAYLRLTREKSPMITDENKKFEIGKAEILKKGSDVTIVGAGPILAEALKATHQLSNDKQRISVEIINLATIKPLDYEAIHNSLRKTKALVTVEEHQLAGGLGSAILESLAAHKFPHHLPIEMIGIKDKFGESGAAKDLWDKYDLNAESIKDAVKKVFEEKLLKNKS